MHQIRVPHKIEFVSKIFTLKAIMLMEAEADYTYKQLE